LKQLRVANENIYESNAQILEGIDPASIVPIIDRVVVRDVKDAEKVGLLYIPMTAQARGIGGRTGNKRMGVVVAVGRGDAWTERLTDGGTRVLRTKLPERAKMTVKVGDLVAWDQRREAEFYVKDERFAIVHEEQSIFGIIETSPGGKMEFRPLYDRILVKRAPEAEKIGNIVIPDDAKEKPQMGLVVAAGNGHRDVNGHMIPLDVKVGDQILFGKHAGSDITIDGVEYVVMREQESFGVHGACQHEAKIQSSVFEWCGRCGALRHPKSDTWAFPGADDDKIARIQTGQSA
jgi:chaperonin GroES